MSSVGDGSKGDGNTSTVTTNGHFEGKTGRVRRSKAKGMKGVLACT